LLVTATEIDESVMFVDVVKGVGRG
jgi:hypothetical protein